MDKIKVRISLYLIVIILITVSFGGGLLFFAIGSGVARAEVLAWEDQNQNGEKDENEKVFSGVCVNSEMLSSRSNFISEYYNCVHKTDENGVSVIDFHVGPCWQIYNIITPPDGYTPTTPNLTIGCKTEVGLVRGVYQGSISKYTDYVEREFAKQKILFGVVVLANSVLVSESIVMIKKKKLPFKMR